MSVLSANASRCPSGAHAGCDPCAKVTANPPLGPVLMTSGGQLLNGQGSPVNAMLPFGPGNAAWAGPALAAQAASTTITARN